MSESEEIDNLLKSLKTPDINAGIHKDKLMPLVMDSFNKNTSNGKNGIETFYKLAAFSFIGIGLFALGIGFGNLLSDGVNDAIKDDNILVNQDVKPEDSTQLEQITKDDDTELEDATPQVTIASTTHSFEEIGMTVELPEDWSVDRNSYVGEK